PITAQGEIESNFETNREITSSSLTNSVVQDQVEEQPAPKKIKTQNWSSYTPHKLKQRISNKLRPTVENPVVQAKAEYYRQKAKETEADIM
ncbi:unnamed protein product, partial [Tenebrio molitor]